MHRLSHEAAAPATGVSEECRILAAGPRPPLSTKAVEGMLMSLFATAKRLTASLLAVAMLGLQISPAQAALIGTQEAVAAERHQVQRAELIAALERDDVRQQLQAMGVDPQAAQERVAALTDQEVAQLNERIGDLPAGGSDVVAIILLIFLVFVITDVIGATDIFPFIHPINK